jgi:predicted small metal-binding protein
MRIGAKVLPQKVINCSCGYIVRAENDDKLVSKAQEHAKQVHQMDLSSRPE